MITLSSNSIRDYQTCARLYDYRYNDDLYEPLHGRDLLAQRYENTLKKIVSFFFYKKQGGQVPSYSALLNRWERYWFPKDMSAYDIALEQHDANHGNLASYTSDATSAILDFYEAYADDPGEPFMVDEDFIVPLSGSVRLEGSFDLVLRYRQYGVFRALKFVGQKKKPSVARMTHDLAVYKYALDYKYAHKGLDIIYGFYDLASTKPGLNSIEIKDEDVNSIIYWAKEIDEEEIFPSRRGLTYYCKVCPFDEICASWKIPLKETVDA